MVVHCDLKPSNVLVTSTNEPKLLDFGIAKVLSQSPEATQSLSLRLGTPQYVSPEQIAGGRITTASDVFSLGGLLFLVLTGSAPTAMREPDQASELASRVCKSKYPARVDRLRGDLDAIVLKARAFHPDQRYLSAAAMAEDLRRHLAGLTVTAPTLFLALCFASIRGSSSPRGVGGGLPSSLGRLRSSVLGAVSMGRRSRRAC